MVHIFFSFQPPLFFTTYSTNPGKAQRSFPHLFTCAAYLPLELIIVGSQKCDFFNSLMISAAGRNYLLETNLIFTN